MLSESQSRIKGDIRQDSKLDVERAIQILKISKSTLRPALSRTSSDEFTFVCCLVSFQINEANLETKYSFEFECKRAACRKINLTRTPVKN